jgi:hypothetical protein
MSTSLFARVGILQFDSFLNTSKHYMDGWVWVLLLPFLLARAVNKYVFVKVYVS